MMNASTEELVDEVRDLLVGRAERWARLLLWVSRRIYIADRAVQCHRALQVEALMTAFKESAGHMTLPGTPLTAEDLAGAALGRLPV
jgi:hypothetical protein